MAEDLTPKEEPGREPEGELAKRWFDALLRESDQVQATISRTLTAAHNTVGIFIPAVLGVFVLTARALEASSTIDLLAIVLAGVFCMARLYADSLWVEFLSYHHYLYGELQPRIYQAAGHKADRCTENPNLGQFVVKHWARRNWPHLVAPHVFPSCRPTDGLRRLGLFKWLSTGSLSDRCYCPTLCLCSFRLARGVADADWF